jgi:hypothetical protein
MTNPKSDPRTSHIERRDLLLWIGLLAPPIAWALHEQLSYMMAETSCSMGNTLLQHLATLGTLLLCLAGGAVAWSRWKRAPESSTEKGDPQASRIRFMALSGMTMSGWFALVILATWIPNFILGPCQR